MSFNNVSRETELPEEGGKAVLKTADDREKYGETEAETGGRGEAASITIDRRDEIRLMAGKSNANDIG